ncbi:class I SAM-dependent methyltransferase [Allokutzneria sp. A3M-2-11 16]|uniref:class I SAM-dependent methyltransferase n=1 Tax=Allokutzneria sp. A3M-2-11 16 TaxID=2962043 RepID=UPI0020B6A70A|nr:class I SAM-dependent methyltransferase [Allokutzneria sp. A3M-2-11 16]MCP3801223.1 class I SAM-dependent methyltransferase [Allokutzneria sp. A3M-2-11 16]
MMLPAEAAELLFGRLAACLGPSALDIGSGSGFLAAEIAARGVRFELTDVEDWRQVSIPGSTFTVASATALPHASGSVGGVHIARVLFHIAEWRTALAEIARVLAPGGRLCLSLGWPLYTGALRELSNAFYDRASEAGLPRDDVRADISGPDQIAASLTDLGLIAEDPIEVSGSLMITPREVIADCVAVADRWRPGQDRGSLPSLGDDVLASSGLPADTPVPQPRTIRYLIFRHP